MVTSVYGIFGASGFGREVMPVLREQIIDVQNKTTAFVDDNPASSTLNGSSVLSYTQFLNYAAEKKYVSIAIADAGVRRKLTERCVGDGIAIASIFAKNSIIMDDVGIGDGTIICPFVTLTSNIRIGKSFHANIYSYVAHDCVIGDFVTFAPGVKCNGNVVIEDEAYIGTGAVIKQGRPGEPLIVGRRAVVGMGAVVTKSVPAGAVVIGNPARLMS